MKRETVARRIIDLTRPLTPEHGDGALVVHEFEREGAGHTVLHRVEMDASLGTHVIAPRRVFRWGAAVGDLGPEAFFGEGVVARFAATGNLGEIGSTELETVLGRRLEHGDIVVLARETGSKQPLRVGVAAAQWLNLHGAKLVVIDENVQIGADEVGGERLVLETFFESNLPVIRDVTNTAELSEERFALMALPPAVSEVAAWPVRVVALDPGVRPEPQAASDDAQAEVVTPTAIELARPPEVPTAPVETPPETGATEVVGARDQAAGDAPQEPVTATAAPDERTVETTPEASASPKAGAAGQTRAKPKSKAETKARAKPKATARPKSRRSKSGTSQQVPDGETGTLA